MPTLEDIEAWRTRQPHKASPEQAMIKGVAVAMSELKGDPKWKLFCDHLEPLRLQAKALCDKLERELIYGPIVADHQFYETKRQLAINITRFDTYTQVIEMIDALINRGESLT